MAAKDEEMKVDTNGDVDLQDEVKKQYSIDLLIMVKSA